MIFSAALLDETMISPTFAWFFIRTMKCTFQDLEIGLFHFQIQPAHAEFFP